MKTIRGYVQVLSRRPGKEEAVRVAIIAEDGTPYHVLHKGAGTALLANINANVEVSGAVSAPAGAAGADDALAGADGEAAAPLLLTVKNFRLTDGYDDPWYDDAVR